MNPTVTKAPEVQANFDQFVSSLATYFMDFLETNFHKRRIPKRSIRYKTDKGLLVGLNLKKYPKFNERIWKVIHKSFQSSATIPVSRGKYTTQIPATILDLIEKQVDKINDEQIEQIFIVITEHIQKAVIKHQDAADLALATALDSISTMVRELLVNPFLSNIEKPLENQSGADIESIYSIEEGLTELLAAPFEDLVADVVNQLIIGIQVDIRGNLAKAFDTHLVKSSISSFFSNFSVNDLYFELQDLFDNNNILDKQDLYLYFCDLQFNNHVYPIFYVPITLEKSQDTFNIVFDTAVYVNKKAIEYVVQEFNKERQKVGIISSIAERILYPYEHGDSFPLVIQGILDDITDHFQLPSKIDVTDTSSQIVRSLSLTLTSSCHICIFDKSDEALVNDYEEMLEYLSSDDNLLANIFSALINRFIKEDPKSFVQEISDEWDTTEASDKLVYSSPIPVNSEQRQILAAFVVPI
jgi:hypothetical protein